MKAGAPPVASASAALHERAGALFIELRALPAEERQRRLEECAASDPALRAEAASLLEHDTVGPGAGAGAQPDLPARIGQYTVLDRIGRGGSGYVFLAEQHEPVRRRVAIKVVPHAAVDPDLAARFEFERRALERTEHPNIARILDAGRTPEGLPYIVIEYVEGVTITEYCRGHGLGLRERIGLVLEVADAVQHAHQRGVIHRDLKPGNILVGERAGRATARVLDFGIAKPTPEAAGADSPPTLGLPLGTPAYMAPEQTGGGAVDIRADVYALGAVLYELLCGRPPIALEAGGDLVAQIRRIREEVPAAASRVRPTGSAEFEPASRSLLADLDCILGRALEKDPARRYPTVAALAADLNRALRREPIEARPATVAYRAARFVQRNRVLAVAAAAGTLALVVGITGLVAGLIEAQRQRREAANQSEAQREINTFLTEDLLAAASPNQEGSQVTALDLLHRASRKVDARFAGRPLVAAAIHHTLGDAYTELGALDEAQRHLERAVELRRAVAGVDAPDTIHSEIAAASLLCRRQRFVEAEGALSELVRRARLIVGADDPALYTAINDLGVAYESLDRGAEAVAVLKEALAGRARLLGPHHPKVFATTANLAQAYERTGDTLRSLEMQAEALRIADSLEEPARMTILELCNNIGATLQDLGRDVEAAPYLRRASDLAGAWLGADNTATLIIRSNLAGLEAELGDPARGAEMYAEVVAGCTRTLGPDALDTLTSRYGYCNSLFLGKRLEECADSYTALHGDMVRVLGEEHWLVAQCRASLARALKDLGRREDALPLARLAAERFIALYGPEHERAKTAAGLLRELSGE